VVISNLVDEYAIQVSLRSSASKTISDEAKGISTESLCFHRGVGFVAPDPRS
jgi:hypothetical protein